MICFLFSNETSLYELNANFLPSPPHPIQFGNRFRELNEFAAGNENAPTKVSLIIRDYAEYLIGHFILNACFHCFSFTHSMPFDDSLEDTDEDVVVWPTEQTTEFVDLQPDVIENCK